MELATTNRSKKLVNWLICLIPVFGALLTWLTPLAFAPVPWPDDSAFYFVAHELFKWPPRWVMLPQAPFEPTYTQFNFNTMPLYPILIGLGRFIGIDGSFALKFWPLSAWAVSGSIFTWVLIRNGLPRLLALTMALIFALDPILRWASVLVRPESLIGLFGLLIVLALSFGIPERWRARGLWDPIALLLALAAYAHFNAIHLAAPVIAALLFQPKQLIKTGARTVLYLSPWLITVLWHFNLFTQQMGTQWRRLAVPNEWLSSIGSALLSITPDMGSPESFPTIACAGSGALLMLLVVALIVTVIGCSKKNWRPFLPSAAWLLSSAWLWDSKPEVWFTYYLHLAGWVFAGMLLIKLKHPVKNALIVLLISSAATYAATTGYLFYKLNEGYSWNWKTYNRFVDCIDKQLTALGSKKVWVPTFPDVTIELSRRHRDWEFTRTNDFVEREALALKHGQEVDALVATETLQRIEREIDAPTGDYPHVRSSWMHWQPYYLHKFLDMPNWKPERHICQTGRWQAFIFSERSNATH